jgi:antirestriction protein ArdC
MGGDDGYYVSLLHELLHATGHPRRLGRSATGDYSDHGYALEEGTVVAAQAIVLREIGFDHEAIEWHSIGRELPIDRRAAAAAAAWVLR